METFRLTPADGGRGPLVPVRQLPPEVLAPDVTIEPVGDALDPGVRDELAGDLHDDTVIDTDNEQDDDLDMDEEETDKILKD